jgi:UDP-GlcNAc:undecaprenyl-phosphate GlcNAc-1-phosphate transferase
VAWQILDRLRRRRSPTEADRGHLHFRLVDLGLSQRAIVLVYWGLCALFGLLALLVASRLWKLVALLALGGVVVVVLVLLSRRSPGDGP